MIVSFDTTYSQIFKYKMASIVISTVENPVSDKHPSIHRSLKEMGRTRYPGTKVRLFPWRETDGRYRTGIDETALYIQKMDKKEAEQEISRIRGWKEKLQSFYGDIDLSPRSEFFTKMTDNKMNTEERCPIAILKDGDNILNLDRKEDLIAYCYLRVHKWVAPSAEALLSGQYADAMFYIKDMDHEDEIIFKRKSEVNKAKQELEKLSSEKITIIAKQLGLPVTDSTKYSTVYRLLDDFISKADLSSANNKDSTAPMPDMRAFLLSVGRSSCTKAECYVQSLSVRCRYRKYA